MSIKLFSFKLKSLELSISSYKKTVRWLLRDALLRERARVFFVLIMGAAGVAFQVAVLGMAVVYAQYFSAGEVMSLAGYSLDPRGSISLLVAGSVGAILLLSLSTLFTYFSGCTVIKMGREYEEFCAKRVFKLLAGGGDLFSRKPLSERAEHYIFRLVRSDSRLAGRVLRQMLSAVIPGLTLIVFVAVLFYLEFVLSLIIVLFGAMLLFYQYRVSRRAAGQSMRFEKLAPGSSAEYRSFIHHLKYLTLSSSVLAEQFFKNGVVKQQLDAYEGRLRAVQESKLFSGFFTAIVLGLILLVMGREIILNGVGWERLLVYIVALRFAVLNLQVVFSSITSINRFYPQVRRYFRFVEAFSENKVATNPARDVYLVEMGQNEQAEVLYGSLPKVEITRGTRIALLSPVELNNYSLRGFCLALFGSDETQVASALSFACYATGDHSCPNSSLRHALRLPDDMDWTSLRTYFPDEKVWYLAREQLPKSLDKVITKERWEQLSFELKVALSLISVKFRKCSFLFMDAKCLGRLDSEFYQFYLKLLHDVVIVLVYDSDLDRVGSFDEEVVAVVAEGSLVGLGGVAWLRGVQGEALCLIARKSPRHAEAKESDFDDDSVE